MTALYIFWWILLSVHPLTTIAQTSLRLSSTQDVACPDDQITFDCMTSGSHSITWESNEYIAQRSTGQQVTFGVDDNQGHVIQISSTDYAVLMLVRNDGVPQLRSQLHITATETSSVTCINNELNRTTVNLKVLNTPGIPQGVIALKVSYQTGQCFITALWQSPVNKDQAEVTYYLISVNDETSPRKNETANNSTIVYSTFFNNTCISDPRVTIRAGNICTTSQPAIIIVSNEGECQRNIELPNSCYATEAPTNATVMPAPQGGSKNNSGNFVLLMVTAMLLLGSV